MDNKQVAKMSKGDKIHYLFTKIRIPVLQLLRTTTNLKVSPIGVTLKKWVRYVYCNATHTCCVQITLSKSSTVCKPDCDHHGMTSYK